MTVLLPAPEETPMPDRQVTTGDLWFWVDRLTRERRERLNRDVPVPGARAEFVTIPALWEQLLDDVASTSSGGSSRAAKAGSRLPLNVESLALLVEIAQFVAGELAKRGEQPRLLDHDHTARAHAQPRLVNYLGHPIHDPQVAGQLVERAARAVADHRDRGTAALVQHDTISDIRRLAATVVSETNQAAVDRLARAYRRFAARIETAVTGEDESLDLHGARHSACPACLAMWVVSDRDGEDFREPALVVAMQDGQVRHVTCRACDTGWWRGEDIQTLTEQMAHNEAVYGPAKLWGHTKPRSMGA